MKTNLTELVFILDRHIDCNGPFTNFFAKNLSWRKS